MSAAGSLARVIALYLHDTGGRGASIVALRRLCSRHLGSHDRRYYGGCCSEALAYLRARKRVAYDQGARLWDLTPTGYGWAESLDERCRKAASAVAWIGGAA